MFFGGVFRNFGGNAMGFMDELKKLTQPYDDEDDFFEGADESFKAVQATTETPQIRGAGDV